MTEREVLNRIEDILDEADYLGCKSVIVRDAMELFAYNKGMAPLDALEYVFEEAKQMMFKLSKEGI